MQTRYWLKIYMTLILILHAIAYLSWTKQHDSSSRTTLNISLNIYSLNVI